ncbi:MAG: helix-turn-helix domain-containing protein [Lysobacterales bacterium]
MIIEPAAGTTWRQTAWSREAGIDARYLRVYIRQLARRSSQSPTNPRHILTEPGAGYGLNGQ